MGYNTKELKASPPPRKPAKSKDVIYDPMGQWAHPGQVTRIPGGDITMYGIPYPVIGIDNMGNHQLMMPGMNYSFPGDYVTEYPMMQSGGSFGKNVKAPIRPVAKPTYSDSNTLITYKNNPDLIEGIANYSAINPKITPEYNEIVKTKLLTGNYGLDPKTGMLHTLQSEDKGDVSSETKRLSQPVSKEVKPIQSYIVKIEDFMDGWNGHNAGDTVRLTPQEYADFNKTYAFEGTKKLMYTGSNIVRSVPGVETLGDAIGLADATIRGDKEGIGIYSAALALPFVPGAITSGLRQVKKLPEKIRNVAPKYETIVRIEPSTYSAKPNPNLPDEMNVLQGRWYGTPEEAASYLKYSKDPNALHHVVQELRIPVTKSSKWKGPNLPEAAKKMSIGYGTSGSWKNLADKYGMSEAELTAWIHSNDDWKNFTEHYNPNELIVPKEIAEYNRANPKIVGTQEELLHYLDLLQRKLQTPYKVPILGTSIPREYIPWLPKSYPLPINQTQKINSLGDIGATRKINLPQTMNNGGYLDYTISDYKKGGLVKRFTNKNIKTSINKLMERNELLFGPKGKYYYTPSMKKKKNGGTPEAFPQQPTSQEFFAQGWIPPGPVGFYMHGGTHLPEAFPQQVPANYFFAGVPWQPHFEMGGGLPGGANNIPCMECGGQHMQQGGAMNVPVTYGNVTIDADPAVEPVRFDSPFYSTNKDYEAMAYRAGVPLGKNPTPNQLSNIQSMLSVHQDPDNKGSFIQTWAPGAERENNIAKWIQEQGQIWHQNHPPKPSFKSGGNWIQDATKSIKARGTEGVCTGDKFGGPTCPPGSKRYNLAKTFKAMAKKQYGGTADANLDAGQDDPAKKQAAIFMNALKNNTMLSLSNDAIDASIDYFNPQGNPMAQYGMSMLDYGFNPNANRMYADKADYMANQETQSFNNFANASNFLAQTANPYMKFKQINGNKWMENGGDNLGYYNPDGSRKMSETGRERTYSPSNSSSNFPYYFGPNFNPLNDYTNLQFTNNYTPNLFPTGTNSNNTGNNTGEVIPNTNRSSSNTPTETKVNSSQPNLQRSYENECESLFNTQAEVDACVRQKMGIPATSNNTNQGASQGNNQGYVPNYYTPESNTTQWTPQGQQMGYYGYQPSAGMQYFPMNANPYMKWNTQGYPMPSIGYNPNTYLRDFEYRGRLIGQGPRKVSMTFRTYYDPTTGETMQVPEGSTPGTPGYNPANPQNLQNSQPTYLTPKERQERDQTRKGTSLQNRLRNLGQNVQEYFNKPAPYTGTLNTGVPSNQSVFNPGTEVPVTTNADWSEQFRLGSLPGQRYGGYKAQGGIEVQGTSMMPDYSWDYNQSPFGDSPSTALQPELITVNQNTDPANNNPLIPKPKELSYFDTKVVGKGRRGYDREALANWTIAGIQGATALANARERRKAEEDAQRMTLADNQFYAAPANRMGRMGEYDMNLGYFMPNQMGVIQQPGQIAMNGGYKQMGGIVELDQDEIDYILANGGSIEYLD